MYSEMGYFASDAPEIVHNVEAPKHSSKNFIKCCMALTIIAALAAAVVFVMVLGDDGNDSVATNKGSSSEAKDEDLSRETPDSQSTSFPSFKPSAFNIPGQSLFPTASPVAHCKRLDTMVDIIILMDESTSVGFGHFRVMNYAIQSFVANLNPPMNSKTGSRIGVVEFSHLVNDVIKLGDFDTAADFNNRLNRMKYHGGGTDHRKAISRAHEMMIQQREEGLIREGSKLALVMLTDGNPCASCNSHCCPDSDIIANGATELRDFRDEFDFSFYFLPITPGPGMDGISLDNFNDAIGPENGSEGLKKNEFIVFGEENFNQLEETLREGVVFPLGACISSDD